jgi:hypothetical protein
MKRIFFSSSLLMVIMALFNSCSTEFEVAAPYKEIPIIVGLLNKSDSIHYVKVNKAYLNKEGSAFLAGTVSDSNIFPYPLSVKLYALNTSNARIDSVTLDTTRITKSNGTFQSNDIVYKTPSYKLKFISFSGADTTWARYEIVVRRASDNKLMASSITSVVSDVRFKAVPRELDIYNPFPSSSTPEYKNPTLRWFTARNGRRYSAFLRFKFRVVNTTLGVNYMDSVDMQLMSNNRNGGSDGKAEITYTFSGFSFYNNLQIALDPLPFGYRREYVGPLEIHFEYAGEDLDTYMEINNSTVSLSEVVPEYTNINGGLGIFSSRVRKKFADIKQTNLSLNSIEGLKTNSIVGRKAGANDLGFY